MAKAGRPKGTTRANGYKVSSGRPKGAKNIIRKTKGSKNRTRKTKGWNLYKLPKSWGKWI
jgi:hypothetical protein